MPKISVKLIIVALSTPLQIGIYQDDKLLETLVSQEHTSDVLPMLFKDILEKYSVKEMVYANGPGSFMSIKVGYLFLKTISIVNNIPFFATDAFYFNENSPIKAVGKLYFVKISSKICTETLSEVIPSEFKLPKQYNKKDFNEDTAPFYGIDAV